MFYEPIKSVVGVFEIFKYEDLFKWAQRIKNLKSIGETKVYQEIGEKIYFIDEAGVVYIAIFRKEIIKLLSIGYKKVEKFREIAYEELERHVKMDIAKNNESEWRKKIAIQIYLADARNVAKKIYEERKKDAIKIDTQKIKYEEIFEEIDIGNNIIIRPVLETLNQGLKVDESQLKEVVGTYVILNEKSICICDEYARTFYVTGSVEEITTFVNELTYYFDYMKRPELFIKLV